MITIHSLTFSIIAFISGIGPRRWGSMELVTWTGLSEKVCTSRKCENAGLFSCLTFGRCDVRHGFQEFSQMKILKIRVNRV